VRAALSLYDSFRAADLVLAQVAGETVQSLGGGMICDIATDASATDGSNGA
jgi:hypothetical protein